MNLWVVNGPKLQSTSGWRLSFTVFTVLHKNVNTQLIGVFEINNNYVGYFFLLFRYLQWSISNLTFLVTMAYHYWKRFYSVQLTFLIAFRYFDLNFLQ